MTTKKATKAAKRREDPWGEPTLESIMCHISPFVVIYIVILIKFGELKGALWGYLPEMRQGKGREKTEMPQRGEGRLEGAKKNSIRKRYKVNIWMN